MTQTWKTCFMLFILYIVSDFLWLQTHCWVIQHIKCSLCVCVSEVKTQCLSYGILAFHFFCGSGANGKRAHLCVVT